MRTRRKRIRVGKFQFKTRQHEQRRLTTIEILEPRLLLAAQAYTWQNAAIGAGGFVDGVFYSPTQQNVVYARTDAGISAFIVETGRPGLSTSRIPARRSRASGARPEARPGAASPARPGTPAGLSHRRTPAGS